MINKYLKTKETVRSKLLKGVIFIFLSLLAIWFGIAGGNLLFNSKINIIKNIDLEAFKLPLDKSFPLIDTIYNSGDIGSSFMGDFKNILSGIFDFDLSNPITILNSQSPSLNDYYSKSYQPKLADKGDAKEPDFADNSNSIPDTPKPNDLIPKDQTPGFKEDASSISTEEGNDDRDYSKNNIVSDGKITLQNETNLKINISQLLREPLKFKFDRKGPKVLIYHTHTSESYSKGWTSDGRYGVVKAGEEIAKNLKKKDNISVIHNATVNDFEYNSSYVNAFRTVSNLLKGNPSVRIVLDVHRDGIGNGEKKLRIRKEINGKYAAQIMFVVGTNASGLNHPNWKENLKLALKLQEKLNIIAPGLAKPIYISRNRYNQHVNNGALIVEIGGDGNTVEESMESAQYIAKAIKLVTDEIK